MRAYKVRPEIARHPDLEKARRLARQVALDNLNKPDVNPDDNLHHDFQLFMTMKIRMKEYLPELHQVIFEALDKGEIKNRLYEGLVEKFEEEGITYDNLKQCLEGADDEAAPDEPGQAPQA